MAIISMYLVLFLLSLIATFLLFIKGRKMKLNYYVALFVSISFVTLAYFAYSTAGDRQTALLANQFTYIDGTFMILFFNLCIMDICKIRVPKAFSTTMSCICLFFLTLAFTIDKTDIFYKRYDFARNYGASHLVVELGVMYYAYILFVLFNMLLPFYLIFYSVKRKKKISYKNITSLSVLLSMQGAMYFVNSFFGIPFDILPIGYVIIEYVILGIIQRLNLYDVSNIAQQTTEDSHQYGYILFDNDKCFVGCNNTAEIFFPELSNLLIDHEVAESYIKGEFVEWINSFERNENPEPRIIEKQDRKLFCSIRKYTQRKEGKVYGFLIEVRDDTKQQLLISELNDMNKKLEAAIEKADQANNAKSTFLASMSHEIRTPINAIIGMNAIAMKACDNEEIIEYLNDVDNASHNLLEIINEILDFSKIEAGKMDIVDNEYKLSKLLKDVDDLISIKAADKKLDFKIQVEGHIPSVLYGDTTRIRQVMVNLLNNAVKYTPSGSVTFNLSCRKVDDDNIVLCFSVVDTGIGIKEEDIGKLFNSFSRVDQKKNVSVEGTGLGLAITDKLIHQMMGSVTVTSVYGEGSTFYAEIPQKVIDSTPISDYKTESKADRSNLTEKEYIDASSVNILVVDDTAVNLKVAKGLLKPTNANVVTCKSGEECLELIVNEHFDIIFLDHMMPVMDGIETLHKARELENNKCKDSKYVALTANAISGIRDMYIEEGFDDYLSKPIDSTQLMAILKKWI